MTTPAGLPAQTRTASIESYGGHLEKRDYQAMGVVNPRTDVGADGFMRMTADLAAVARVAPFCVLTVQCNDTTPAAPTVLRIQQMGIISMAGYEGDSPPNAALPTLARVGDGQFTIAWPATTTDDYGISANVDLVHFFGTPQGGAEGDADAEFSDGQTLAVHITDSGGDMADGIVTIEVG